MLAKDSERLAGAAPELVRFSEAGIHHAVPEARGRGVPDGQRDDWKTVPAMLGLSLPSERPFEAQNKTT